MRFSMSEGQRPEEQTGGTVPQIPVDAPVVRPKDDEEHRLKAELSDSNIILPIVFAFIGLVLALALGFILTDNGDIRMAALSIGLIGGFAVGLVIERCRERKALTPLREQKKGKQ